MRLPKLAIQNYQFTLIVVILLVMMGIISVFQMPKSEDPAVSQAGSSIYAIYPGATPADMEQLVVEPIEDAINELDDIKKLKSTSNDGLAVFAVEFEAGSDPDEKFSDVNDQVNGIRQQLPEGIVYLETMKWSVSDTKIMQLALMSKDAEYREMEKQVERLEKILKKVAGVKRVETWAFPEQEVRVSLDMERMARLNISLDRIMGAVKSANMNIPGGTVEAGIKRFSIQTSGSYESVEQIKNTVVHSEGTRVVYLKDIADVALTYEDNNYFARFNGRRALFVTVMQKEETNIFNIVGQIKEKVADFQSKLPSTMRLDYVYDQSESVDDRLAFFLSAMAQGIILVGIVILLAIGLRGSFIVMTAIPISLLIGVGVLAKSGYGLEQMSITGLVITLGLLVDNAIVVIENISRFIKKGETNLNAAFKGTSQIAWAIVSATATTVLAFFPIATMRDVSGDFIRSMPMTVIFTLVASLFIALSFTPFLATRVLRNTKERKESKMMKQFGRFVEGPYRKWLAFSLRKPLVIVVLAGSIFVGSLMLFPLVGVSFFPKAEKPMFFIDVNLPEGSSITETDKAVRFVEERLEAAEDVNRYAANIGRSNPRIYYNIIEKQKQSNLGHVFVHLEEGVTYEQAAQIIGGLRKDFQAYAGARIEIKELEQGPPVNAPIEIIIRGEKNDMLRTIASEIEELFRNTPGLININNPLSTAKTDIRVRINRDKAAMYGIPLAEIDRTVRMSVAGLSISKYRDKDGKEYNIVLRSAFDKEHAKPRLDIFDKIYLKAANGAVLPLSEVATPELKLSSTKISHFNLDRSVTLTSDVLRGYAVNDVTAEVMAKLEAYRWPVGYDYFVGGEKESQEKSFGGMGEAVIIAMISIFAVLVLQFKSFTQPLIVFAALPLAIIGSVVALLITGNTFSFTAFIGITSLVGIVVNNSIILVDYTNQLRARGIALVEALQRAGETRFMPIILTTFTTVGGLLPLTLQGGTLWAPMGWTIIGGLLTSTFLTLIVVPVLYKLFSNGRKVEA